MSLFGSSDLILFECFDSFGKIWCQSFCKVRKPQIIFQSGYITTSAFFFFSFSPPSFRIPKEDLESRHQVFDESWLIPSFIARNDPTIGAEWTLDFDQHRFRTFPGADLEIAVDPYGH